MNYLEAAIYFAVSLPGRMERNIRNLIVVIIVCTIILAFIHRYPTKAKP